MTKISPETRTTSARARASSMPDGKPMSSRIRQHADLPRVHRASQDGQGLQGGSNRYVYGTLGTPTTDALKTAWIELAGAAGTVLTPSGLAAVTMALLAVLRAGDQLLVTDFAYVPTRRFSDRDPEALRGQDPLLRPKSAPGIAELSTPTPGPWSSRPRGRRASRCRTSRPSQPRRTGATSASSWTTPGRRRCSSAARARRRHRDRGRHQISLRPFRPAARPDQRQRTLLAGAETNLHGIRHVRGPGGRVPGPARAAHHGTAAARGGTAGPGHGAGSRPGRKCCAVLHPALPDHPGHAIWKRISSAPRGCSRWF